MPTEDEDFVVPNDHDVPEQLEQRVRPRGRRNEDRLAEGFGSMGIPATARKLSNMSAMVIIAAIAVVLLGVLTAVMWSDRENADRRTDALIQAQNEAIKARGVAQEAQQKREDSIRAENNALFERVITKLENQTAATIRLADSIQGAMAEMRTTRIAIENTAKDMALAVIELKKAGTELKSLYSKIENKIMWPGHAPDTMAPPPRAKAVDK